MEYEYIEDGYIWNWLTMTVSRQEFIADLRWNDDLGRLQLKDKYDTTWTSINDWPKVYKHYMNYVAESTLLED